MTTPGNTVTPEMPKREMWLHPNGYVSDTNLGGKCERYIPAALLTEARELLERAKNMIDPNSLAHSQISNFLERLRPL